MVELLLVMLVPTLVFGIFALLSVWLGAESRPWFDERPVLDDRPNWFPIVRRVPDDDDDEDDDDEPHDGTPAPVPTPAQPRQRRPAAATSAATSPSGV
jgi:hypothetical protein